MSYIDVTGKTEEDAVAKALVQLGLDRDDVSVEVLERAKSGFLGLGSCPAKVRVTYGGGSAEEAVPAVSKVVESPVKPVEEKKRRLPVRKPKAPETKAPEAKAPEAKAPEAKAPEAKAPETKAPEAKAPEAKTPETKAPEAKAPEAKAPETKAPETKTPEAATSEPEEYDETAEPEVDDEKAQAIQKFLSGLLEQMDHRAVIHVYLPEKGRYKVILEGEDMGALIGRRGETLDAIQQLTSYSVNRGSGNRARIQLDAENYRERREQSLTRLAMKVAGKVVKYRHNVTLEPMNAYERHVIHAALQDTKNVTTYSTGTDPNRRVIVAYDRDKQ
jgi:spoIIIJ-associated protein